MRHHRSPGWAITATGLGVALADVFLIEGAWNYVPLLLGIVGVHVGRCLLRKADARSDLSR
jgi:hypothetical protein